MTLLVPVLAALPWFALVVFLGMAVRVPRPLPPLEAGGRRHGSWSDAPSAPPSVSVVVPARNEAADIERCVRSLAASAYPDFEILVVDDRSDDGTAARVRGLGAGRARRLRVVEGAPLPEGWLGKPWACRQGARAAQGDILLFTDADTIHEPDLLARAVSELRGSGADLLTVAGRQILESFWERLVQPQVFLAMLMRFWNVERRVAAGRWRGAIANGQYMMFPRDSYDALGGHDAVKDEVVEDLAMAQHVVRSGRRLCLRLAEDGLGTRMYTSLAELVEGWSKNLHLGGQQSMPPWARPLIPVASVALGLTLWVLPPLVLVAATVGWIAGGAWVPPGVVVWSGVVAAVSTGIWATVYRRMGVRMSYALLYPVGAAVTTGIYVRSWRSGLDVEWKGRRYRLKAIGD